LLAAKELHARDLSITTDDMFCKAPLLACSIIIGSMTLEEQSPSPLETATSSPSPVAPATPVRSEATESVGSRTLQPSVGSSPTVQQNAAASAVEYQRVLMEQSKSYQEFLRTETDRHETYLEKLFQKVEWLVGIALSALLAITTWLGWNTQRDVKRQFERQFGSKVDSIIGERLKGVRNEMKNAAFKHNSAVEDLKSYTKRELDDVAEFASIMAHASYVIHLPPPKDEDEKTLQEKMRVETAERLEPIQQKVPAHRTSAIFLGLLFREMKELKKAIAVLEKTIAAREQRGMDNNRDHAAVLYNKACYLNVLARKASNARESERLREEAWRDLSKCVQLSPADLEEAKLDEDLNPDLIQPPKREWTTL
jgi:tetratricopeptide (TPR) repeat protein